MKLAIHGCYHLPNFGDLLLHDILVNWIREKWQIEPVTLDPYDPKTKTTLFSIGQRVLRSCRSDFAVLGGGGYFVRGYVPCLKKRIPLPMALKIRLAY